MFICRFLLECHILISRSFSDVLNHFIPLIPHWSDVGLLLAVIEVRRIFCFVEGLIFALEFRQLRFWRQNLLLGYYGLILRFRLQRSCWSMMIKNFFQFLCVMACNWHLLILGLSLGFKATRKAFSDFLESFKLLAMLCWIPLCKQLLISCLYRNCCRLFRNFFF